jgi:8-oxo-dGTP pyrophosphatase MutT (NUDIX family)
MSFTFAAENWVTDLNGRGVAASREEDEGTKNHQPAIQVSNPILSGEGEYVDDKAAAIREASEEIGLDLTTEDTISVGNLPERVGE